MDKVLRAKKNYDDTKKALRLKDRTTVKVDGLTLDINDVIKECIEDVLKDNYRNACKAYYDELDRLKKDIWEEYMNTFSTNTGKGA